MPRYTILNKKTKKEYEIEMSYEDLEGMLKDENLQQIFVPIPLCYRVGRIKVSEAWRSKLKGIKKAHRGNTIEIP